MGTPPCESGFMKVTVARRWETAERRTEYGFDGTSERTETMTWVKRKQHFNYNKDRPQKVRMRQLTMVSSYFDCLINRFLS